MILCSNCQHGGGRVEMLEGGIKRLSLNKPQNRSDTRQLCSGTKSERGITFNWKGVSLLRVDCSYDRNKFT